MKSNVFVDTNNVTKFRKALGRLIDQGVGLPGLMVVQGKSGRGKSQAAINYHAKNEAIFLRVWQDWTQHAFLQSLAKEVTGVKMTGTNRCKMEIVENLTQQTRPIIIDEADRLKVERIEDLRDIQEITGVPIVLIGEEGLHAKYNGRQRIYSRVAEVVEFEPIESMDVLIFATQAADLTLDSSAAEALAAQSGGSFRMVYNLISRLEEFALANSLKEIDCKVLADAGLIRKGGKK